MIVISYLRVETVAVVAVVLFIGFDVAYSLYVAFVIINVFAVIINCVIIVDAASVVIGVDIVGFDTIIFDEESSMCCL